MGGCVVAWAIAERERLLLPPWPVGWLACLKLHIDREWVVYDGGGLLQPDIATVLHAVVLGWGG